MTRSLNPLATNMVIANLGVEGVVRIELPVNIAIREYATNNSWAPK